MKTYSQALSYLESLVNYEKIPPHSYDDKTYSLSRMEALLGHLGDPHTGVKSIHIAGTNGKGSVACMLASVLREAGFKVGFYSSPHLISFCERIRIGNELISEDRVTNLVGLVRRAVEKLEQASLSNPSFFEVYTAVAFLYFAEEHVDLAVVEAGLGGRLDATNVLSPELSILTTIDIDHEKQLGKSRAAIAGEKSGIIKEKTPVIVSSQEEDVLKVIEEKCALTDSPVTEVRLLNSGHKGEGSFSSSHEMVFLEKESVTLRGCKFHMHRGADAYCGLETPLLGEHQIVNAGVAAAAAQFFKVTPNAIRNGLLGTDWPGRLQLLDGNPSFLLDGAHNPGAAKALASSLRALFSDREITLILGVSSDKDIKGIGRELLPLSNRVILTRADNPRAAAPLYLKEQLSEFFADCEVANSSSEALRAAIRESSDDALICVSGSLFLVGEVLAELQKEEMGPGPIFGSYDGIS